MANEDEKVLIVPPFGRKDIQEIANEGDEADSYDEVVALVDKAIKNGDIPSGTKLYKHHIVLNTDDDSIDIISPVSSQILTDAALFTSNAVLINADLPSEQMNGIAIIGDSLITEYQGQLSTYNVPEDFESDTVTEL